MIGGADGDGTYLVVVMNHDVHSCEQVGSAHSALHLPGLNRGQYALANT